VSLFAEYGPRTSSAVGLDILQGLSDPNTRPADALIQAAINNSNVAGVTSGSAAGSGDVNTGIELCIDLDELGWDGVSDILIAGWIASSDFGFVSNQVLGGLPAGDNLGEVANIDFSLVDGTQYVNLSATVEPCIADRNDDGMLDFFDVQSFLAAFSAQDPSADLNNDDLYDFFDVQIYLGLFSAGCP
jgi:hypothetical protein